MGDPKVKHEEKVVDDHGPQIGTWFSLGILGIVIFATFILMFSVYFARL
ncbi:hypothetical protein [Salipaludibacillus neizhouensis]|nr:hypothetical protein [Salipaludibacillus neizhouensis]